jgi:hypothetical protein
VQVTERVILHIRVGRPPRASFFRVHPDHEYTWSVHIIEDDENRDQPYIVAPAIAEALGEGLAVRKAIALAMTRQGGLFLWTVRLPDSSGRLDNWSTTALEALKHARSNWTRLVASQAERCYIVSQPANPSAIPEPIWPDISMAEAVDKAFRDRIIRHESHPLIMRIVGRV